MKPLYNNYVLQPMGIFVISLFVVVSATIAIVYAGIIEPIKLCFEPTELQFVEIQPTGYEFINDCVIITTSGRGYLLYQATIEDPEILLEKSMQGVRFFGRYSVASEKKAHPFLWELRSEDGSIQISLHDTVAASRSSAKQSISISAMAIIALWAIWGWCTYALYNAPRYPRLARLLIREEFRNF